MNQTQGGGCGSETEPEISKDESQNDLVAKLSKTYFLMKRKPSGVCL